MELQVSSHGSHRDGQFVVHLRQVEKGVLEPGKWMDFIGDCASLSSLGHSDPPGHTENFQRASREGR